MDHIKYGGNNKIGFGQRKMLLLNQMNSSVNPCSVVLPEAIKEILQGRWLHDPDLHDLHDEYEILQIC
ncbi:hypothetical protein OIU84_026916 [Salix udensis]|uniref:Uncharacterized protein n=1 Tax=Salix udensis TaxID=889485 RepID=A0AAD6KE51_9ROSI|nr:hypothetical protein OIU84_026916 [Salix udensis]KAJ6421882.1 hypothetical protein OIU84_026916 [Salix udensis]